MRDHSVSEVMEKCYTRRQLIEALGGELTDESLDGDDPVFFTCDYGDHCHTEQALPVGEILDAESSDMRTTAYSHSGICLVENCYEEDGPLDLEVDHEPRTVVILRS